MALVKQTIEDAKIATANEMDNLTDGNFSNSIGKQMLDIFAKHLATQIDSYVKDGTLNGSSATGGPITGSLV
jgi:hypothetical protein